MKILFISPLLPPSGIPAGGIAIWTKHVLNSTYSIKNEVEIVNTIPIGKRLEKLNSKRKIIEESVRFFNVMKNLVLELKYFNPDIVHINSSCSVYGMIREIICCIFCARKKIVLHFHCDISHMVRNNFSKFILKKLVKFSDLNITLNAISREFLNSNFSVDSIIIPNFIDSENCHFIESEKNISQKVRTAVFTGHITESKGCDLILKLAEDNPVIMFYLVGHKGLLFENKVLPKNFVLVGELNHDEVIRYLIKSDVFIFPTQSEGFPISLLEAMLCGLPIISTSVGAIPDMIEDKGGILVPVGNYNELSNALTKLEPYEVRKNMSDWNKKKVRDFYREDKVLFDLFSAYERLVKNEENSSRNH